MKQSNTPFATSTYSKVTKCWLVICMLVNFVWGVYPFYTQNVIIPFTALALINIYAVTLLFKMKKQGLYILASAEIVLVIYSLIRHHSMVYFLINFLLLCFTWIFVRTKWSELT